MDIMRASYKQYNATIPSVKSIDENIGTATHWWSHDVTTAPASVVTSAYLNVT